MIEYKKAIALVSALSNSFLIFPFQNLTLKGLLLLGRLLLPPLARL